MRRADLRAAILLGGGSLVAAQTAVTTPCVTPTISTCTTLRTVYTQQTLTATNVLSANFLTVTSIYRGAGTLSPNPSVTTIAQPFLLLPGTVEVLYNPATVTNTVLGSGSATITSTISQQAGPTPGLVDVFIPSYVTVTTTSGFINTITTVRTPAGTVQGTVEVVVPSSTVVYCNLNGARTATPDPAATGLASNKGVEYGIWNSPYFDSPPFDENNGFANYNVTDFDAANRAALHLGKTQRIGYSVGTGTTTQPVYSDTTQSFSTSDITLIHRGFVYARTTGTYTFTSINPDDIILVWTGNNAISGFTRANANIAKAYPAGTTSFTILLTAGQYEPFRVQWANGGVPGFLGFRINGPTGAVLFDTNGSTDVVTAACDGRTPVFPAFVSL